MQRLYATLFVEEWDPGIGTIASLDIGMQEATALKCFRGIRKGIPFSPA